MIADIVSHGRKIVNIVDPHLSTRQEYEIGQKFKKNGINYLGYYVKTSRGNDPIESMTKIRRWKRLSWELLTRRFLLA